MLQYEDWVIYRKNKQAPYNLTEKMYGDPHIKAFIFQKHIKNEIKDKLPVESEKNVLFGFGSRIGALVIYTMIQALQPKSEKQNQGLKLRIETIQIPIKEAKHKLLVNNGKLYFKTIKFA